MYLTVTRAYDHDIEQRILEFLYARGVPDLRQIRVKVSGGVATVRGSLPSLHDQLICLECCRHVAGVVRVVDKTRLSKSKKPTQATPAEHTASTNWIEWTA